MSYGAWNTTVADFGLKGRLVQLSNYFDESDNVICCRTKLEVKGAEMKLSLLAESVDIFNHTPFSLRAELQDDTNRLVAYRLYINGKATYVWPVSLNGQRLGIIIREDSKWIHDNWKIEFATKYDRDLEAGFQQIMTGENRAYLTEMMKRLSLNIRRAISARQANVVVLPIDHTKL